MTEQNTETTQDMDVDSGIHDEMLDTFADDFFDEALPEDGEDTVEADEELHAKLKDSSGYKNLVEEVEEYKKKKAEEKSTSG